VSLSTPRCPHTKVRNTKWAGILPFYQHRTILLHLQVTIMPLYEEGTVVVVGQQSRCVYPHLYVRKTNPWSVWLHYLNFNHAGLSKHKYEYHRTISLEWSTPIYTLFKCILCDSVYLTDSNVHNYSDGLYHQNVFKQNVSEVGSTGILLCIQTVQTFQTWSFWLLCYWWYVWAKCRLVFKMVLHIRKQ
jgi:hypothetical protein